jgi:hypothetical protein
MIWFLGICLIGFLIFYFPAFRRFSLYAIGTVCVIALLVYGYYRQKETAEKSLISSSQLTLSDVTLTTDFGYSISGEVQNNSRYALSAMTIKVTAFDCPTLVIDRSCRTIGEDEDVQVWTEVPPAQVRRFSGYVTLSNMPAIRGKFVWQFEVVGTKGH